MARESMRVIIRTHGRRSSSFARFPGRHGALSAQAGREALFRRLAASKEAVRHLDDIEAALDRNPAHGRDRA